MKTILITGTSSGFGLETAKYFLERGWRVVATMRKPNKDLFPKSENLLVLPLDVTNETSIKKVIADAGPIDVLVNNAGIGLLNAVEGQSLESVKEVFETNTIGTIAMTQAVLPQMRERKSGQIINVTSTVTYKTLPLLAVYSASKAAVNAFTESLALEVQPFNIRVNLVLPGRSDETAFAKNAFEKKYEFSQPYMEMINGVLAHFQNDKGPVTYQIDVAKAVWDVTNNPKSPMHTPAGADAVIWDKERQLIR